MTTAAPISGRKVDPARAQAIRQRYKANRGRTYAAIRAKTDRFTEHRHADLDRQMDDALYRDRN
jgi:hypothetical protein